MSTRLTFIEFEVLDPTKVGKPDADTDTLATDTPSSCVFDANAELIDDKAAPLSL